MQFYILSLSVLFLAANTFAQEISVETEYFLNKKLKIYSDLKYTAFVKNFSLKNNDQSITAFTVNFDLKKMETYKHWQLSISNHTDMVSVVFGYNETYKDYEWTFVFGKDTLKSFFESTNDPRLITIEFKGKKYWMHNFEPDCNSQFELHASTSSGQANPLMTAEATNACRKATWQFDMAEDAALAPEVVTAFCFTSIMAMNVRYFGAEE